MFLRINPTEKLLIAILVGLPLAGCGDENAEGRFAISGNVTYDGQPVANGSIGFVSAKPGIGQPAGTSIVDGHYEIPQSKGPAEGSYRVMIDAERSSGRKIPGDEGSTEMVDEMEQYIPAIYNSRSMLTVELSVDRDDLDFNLEKPKRTKRRRR